MSPRERAGSFSSKVKEELKAYDPKKKCCKRAFEDALCLRSSDEPDKAVQNEKMICDKCLSRFVAGLFVSFGSVTDPSKAHHMEFSLTTEEGLEAVSLRLEELGFPPAETIRKGRYIAYFKNADTIIDLLGTMGANNSMFDYLNARIVDSIKNDTNRRVNFDSANIKKSLNASKAQTDVIELIIKAGFLNELDAGLREAALLRIEYPESTLTELGLKFHDPISKSGVKHRLDKIIEFARSKKLI